MRINENGFSLSLVPFGTFETSLCFYQQLLLKISFTQEKPQFGGDWLVQNIIWLNTGFAIRGQKFNVRSNSDV